MTKYILKRVLLMIPTLIGVAVLIFFLMRVVPGDIVELRFAGESGSASKETLAIEHAMKSHTFDERAWENRQVTEHDRALREATAEVVE